MKPGRTPVVALAGLALLGTILEARADDFGTGAPLAEDARSIRSCIGTNKNAGERRRCIGLVVDPCLKTPDGQSTLGMDQCQSREMVVWDQVLNEAYKSAMKRFDDPGKSYLRDVQTLWIKVRDQSCRWPSKVYPGGSISGPLTGGCLLDETANRAIALLEIAESLETH